MARACSALANGSGSHSAIPFGSSLQLGNRGLNLKGFFLGLVPADSF